ncbi:MAG: sortase [Bacilli bacterium]|nr:sortase [Bacilli bacterium]
MFKKILTIFLYIFSTFSVYKNTTTVPNIKENKIIQTEEVEKVLMTLEIPSLRIKNKIYNIDSKENNIDKNVIIVKNSSMPDSKNGLIIIGAHSGIGKYAYFKDLDKLKIGDEIFITYNNKIYTYIINEIYLDDKDGNIIVNNDKNKKQLYLFTCNPKDKKNYLIISCIEK